MGGHALILLDTHAWIWWQGAPHKLSRAARLEIDRAAALGIPAICCYEVAWLAEHGRIRLDRPSLQWVTDALAETRTELVPISPAIAVTAARMGSGGPREPADRLIAATAQELGAPLVTKDARLSEYTAIRTIW